MNRASCGHNEARLPYLFRTPRFAKTIDLTTLVNVGGFDPDVRKAVR